MELLADLLIKIYLEENLTLGLSLKDEASMEILRLHLLFFLMIRWFDEFCLHQKWTSTTNRWLWLKFIKTRAIGIFGIVAHKRSYSSLKTDSQIFRRNFLPTLGEKLCNINCAWQRVISPPSLQFENSFHGQKERRNWQISPHHNKTSTKCFKCQRMCCGSCEASKCIMLTCKLKSSWN